MYLYSVTTSLPHLHWKQTKVSPGEAVLHKPLSVCVRTDPIDADVSTFAFVNSTCKTGCSNVLLWSCGDREIFGQLAQSHLPDLFPVLNKRRVRKSPNRSVADLLNRTQYSVVFQSWEKFSLKPQINTGSKLNALHLSFQLLTRFLLHIQRDSLSQEKFPCILQAKGIYSPWVRFRLLQRAGRGSQITSERCGLYKHPGS